MSTLKQSLCWWCFNRNGMQPQRFFVDHPDYQCNHTAWGMKVIEAVNSPRVKLLYDIYHMQVMEGDVIRTLLANIAHIGHIHTAGNPSRHDMDETQELYYLAILRAIAKTGYEGFVAHEFVPMATTIEGMFEAMRAAYQLAGDQVKCIAGRRGFSRF